jgi:hypothetical protein
VLSGGYTVDTAGGTTTIIEERTDIGILAEGDNGYVMSWKNGATVANIKLFVQCADLGTPLGATATGAGAERTASTTDASRYKSMPTKIVKN